MVKKFITKDERWKNNKEIRFQSNLSRRFRKEVVANKISSQSKIRET